MVLKVIYIVRSYQVYCLQLSYTNIKQDHRGIKSRYKVIKGFKNTFSALIFCTAFEEIRQYNESWKNERCH